MIEFGQIDEKYFGQVYLDSSRIIMNSDHALVAHWIKKENSEAMAAAAILLFLSKYLKYPQGLIMPQLPGFGEDLEEICGKYLLKGIEIK